MFHKETNPFYLTRAWKMARARVLARDNHLCQDCVKDWREGIIPAPRMANCVHHVLPLETHPDKALDDDNLISLCSECHNKRHPEKSQGEAAKPVPAGVRVIKV